MENYWNSSSHHGLIEWGQLQLHYIVLAEVHTTDHIWSSRVRYWSAIIDHALYVLGIRIKSHRSQEGSACHGFSQNSCNNSDVALIPEGCTSKRQLLCISLYWPFNSICCYIWVAKFCCLQLSAVVDPTDRLKTSSNGKSKTGKRELKPT